MSAAKSKAPIPPEVVRQCTADLETLARQHLQAASSITRLAIRMGRGDDPIHVVSTIRRHVGAGRPARFADKRAVRITVKIPRGDRALVPWPTWAKKRLDPRWYATMDKIGGGKSRTWFLYWGTIPPEWFVRIEHLRESLTAGRP